MNAGGWFVMLLSVLSSYLLFGWCVYRLLRGQRKAAVHTIHERTPDSDDPGPTCGSC